MNEKTVELRPVGLELAASKLTTTDLKTLSALTDRMLLAQTAGMQFDGERDLYSVFGYAKVVTPEQLLSKYNRQDIASRIVDAPPGATWSRPPTMKEVSTLSNEWDALVKNNKLKFHNALYRVDRLSRLNRFSLLLFGFDDGKKLNKPVTKATELLYVRPIAGRQVTEITFNKNERDPRFGQPETYTIKFDNPDTKTGNGLGAETSSSKPLTVHWSRCIHVVEYPLEDATYGTPIMEKVYNLLDDLLKVSGGTSEMYWLTGNRGLHADIDKEMEIDPADAAALSDEILEYQHQLRRVIRTRGVTLKALESSVPNPKETFEMIMSIISGTTGIPRRILVGSEAGQLASEQDRANWAERIEERRILFVNPEILNPTVDRLQAVGILSEGQPEWLWPSAFIQNPLEEGQTMAQIARSVGNLSRQTGASTPMQLMSEEEARNVIGLEGTIPDTDRYELPEYLVKKESSDGSSGGSKKESDAAKAARAEKKADQAVSDRQA